MIITSFKGKYEFLSNFYSSPMRIFSNAFQQIMLYDTNEHLYQSAKTTDLKSKLRIIQAFSPGLAKKFGRNAPLRPDWEQIKYPIMLFGVRTKFRQNLIILDKLLSTDNAYLIESNYWHDNLWGDCQCKKCVNKKGMNWLGQVLMTVREENRNIGRL